MNSDSVTPHRRFNPLTEEWVIVSPQRGLRPWQGQSEAPQSVPTQHYDPNCYLCPGNTRTNGVANPNYSGVFVFDNDTPALLSQSEDQTECDLEHPLLRRDSISGCCRVVCYSPDHARSLPRLSENEIEALIDTWINELTSLSSDYTWVQIFENKGAMMGCSSPHPHGQIWASSVLPTEVRKEHNSQRRYCAENGRALLLEYAQHELTVGKRVVLSNEDWVVVVPYWAAWPFETLLLPRQRVIEHLDLTTHSERASLAVAIKQLTTRYDNLFETPFPYSMGWHGAPKGAEGQGWQLHGHFYPPLLRSATVRKFMVGFELLAETQRDITPEQAAERLRELPEQHYLDKAAS